MVTTMNDTKTLPNTKTLRRVVGYVLAARAKDSRKHYRKYGAKSYNSEMDLSSIRRAVMDIYAPHGVNISVWSEANKHITEGKIRAALKHWEAQGKVLAHKHGRAGNGYEWVLVCVSKQWERNARKREAFEKARLIQHQKSLLKLDVNRNLADTVANLLDLAPNSIQASSSHILLTPEQAQEVIYHLQTLDSVTLRRKAN